MVHEYVIQGLKVQTGDLICTKDGLPDGSIIGEFWRLVGKLIQGPVDHIVVYVGPGGRCVEAGAKGKVIAFDVPGAEWNAREMMDQRGPFVDELYGVAYPILLAAEKDPQSQAAMRESVADYCLQQASLDKPYNLNFLDSGMEDAFYCSQLAYQAYLRHGIDLNTDRFISAIPGTSSIVFPQEIWESCPHTKV